MTTFKDAALAAKYEILGADQKVTLPDGFNGKLSHIRDEAALKGMIARGSTLVGAKAIKTATGDAPSSVTPKPTK